MSGDGAHLPEWVRREDAVSHVADSARFVRIERALRWLMLKTPRKIQLYHLKWGVFLPLTSLDHTDLNMNSWELTAKITVMLRARRTADEIANQLGLTEIQYRNLTLVRPIPIDNPLQTSVNELTLPFAVHWTIFQLAEERADTDYRRQSNQSASVPPSSPQPPPPPPQAPARDVPEETPNASRFDPIDDADGHRSEGEGEPDQSRNRRGRPGMAGISCTLFQDRRDEKLPLLRPRAAEAGMIRRRWPKGTKAPKVKTIGGHISAVYAEAMAKIPQ